MIADKSRYVVLAFVCLVTLLRFSYAYANESGAIYIAGFVKDESGVGIRDAIVIITDRHKKLYSMRSAQGGWFETASPLGDEYIGKELRITVIKSGYESNSEIFTISKGSNFLESIEVHPITDYHIDLGFRADLSNVFYGYVHDDKTDEPIKGSVIDITEGRDNIPVSSAVTRESGYFSLYYQDRGDLAEKAYKYSAKHYEHNTVEGEIKLDPKPDFMRIALKQSKHSYSIGPALHFQTTGEVSDLETGLAFMLNLSWYPKAITVIDHYFPRFEKSGFIGYDFSIGFMPYLNAKEGIDEVENIRLLGIGASFAKRGILIPLRVGVTYSHTDKAAVYIGINIPMVYFK